MVYVSGHIQLGLFLDEDGSDVMFFAKLIEGKAIKWKI